MALSIPQIDPEWDNTRAGMAYAAVGWYVLPIEPDTKRPAKFLRKGWQSKSSRDPQEIAAWFAGSNYLLGLHVGRSGAVVIDLDHWDAPDFPVDAKMWLDTAPFQSTRDNDEHRGHYVFAVPEGRILGNSRGGLGKGFGEVRGANGIIVVQPSTHVEEHGRYEWQRIGPVPVLPNDISDLLPEGQAADEAATDSDIKAFLAKYTASERPTLLKPILSAYAAELPKGRHEALVRAAVWSMREAMLGYFPAKDAWDALWTDFEAAMAGERERFPRSEFRGVMAWAVAQALATDPEVRRNEVEKRLEAAEPLPAVAISTPTGTEGANDEADGPDEWAPPRPESDYIDPKDGLKAALLADDVLAMGPLAWGRDTAFWSYRDGVWRSDEDVVEARCVRLLRNRLRGAHITNASTIVKHRVGRITCEPLEAYMNFTNGMLDWRNGDDLTPHAPHYGSTVQFPLDWTPGAECPEFDKFLESILSPEYVKLTWEMIGYLMMSGNPLQVAFLLVGSGDNGKGTLMRVVQALLGDDNTSSLTLDALAEKFAPLGLFGKIANLAGDIDATFQETTAGFKRLTGEDKFRAEVKFIKNPFYFTNWAVPVFSANKIWASSDTSWGYLRRWKIIEFDRTIEKKDVIPGYSNLLITELPGIAVKAVAALREMMARNGGKGAFHTGPDIEHGAERFAEAIDQTRQFVMECCMDAPDTFTPRASLYKVYQLWAQQNGVKPFKSSELQSRLDGMGYRGVKRRGTYGNIGIIAIEHRVKDMAEQEVEGIFD